ncbi:MAG: hypothetical protein INR62_01795 [Rhodospirillales bacterium]|nr:hypothetical protein [Acetobacter sp.]
MNNPWRQVRIFTSDFSDQWYFGFLQAFAVPFASRYPETPFWFTRYTGNRNDPNDDKDDTQITDLRSPFLSTSQDHRSLRLRFCPAADEESFLDTLFTAKFWRSGFLPFDSLGQLGGSRFCSSTIPAARERRATLLAQSLCAHSRYVLDAFNGTDAFEENLDQENSFNKSAFTSTLHLYNNVCGTSDGNKFPLYILDIDSGSGNIRAGCGL